MGKLVSAREAVERIRDGDRIMIGGFGLRGSPDELVDELVSSGKKELTIISNDLGSPNQGLVTGCLTLVPQGTLAESIRAAGAGIPAYYTPTSAGTDLESGKEVREFDGVKCVLEKAIGADTALIHAFRADTLGTLAYNKTARNFNPLMASAAKYTIAEVDEVVEAGALDPEEIVTPHIYVDSIVVRSKK